MDKKYLALELVLEDGMSASAAAVMVGETPKTVEKWLADYQADHEERLMTQEADLIEKQKQLAETQDEIGMRRTLYELVIDRPNPQAEKASMKYWEAIPDSVRHKIVTNAFCIDCGATIITDYVMQGDEEGIALYGKCGKCGKSMATSAEM